MLKSQIPTRMVPAIKKVWRIGKTRLNAMSKISPAREASKGSLSKVMTLMYGTISENMPMLRKPIPKTLHLSVQVSIDRKRTAPVRTVARRSGRRILSKNHGLSS